LRHRVEDSFHGIRRRRNDRWGSYRGDKVTPRRQAKLRRGESQERCGGLRIAARVQREQTVKRVAKP
jgi:hypothetical protein